MVCNGRYDTGRFVVIYPAQNDLCERAVARYRAHLVSDDPVVSGFEALTLEACIDAYRMINEQDMADALYGRYLDFGRVEQVVFGEAHTGSFPLAKRA